MTDPTRRHKLAELTAYVYGEGTLKKRAAFERHVADCPDCQSDVALLRRLLPYAHAQLRKSPDTSIDGLMRLMARAERDLQKKRPVRPRRKPTAKKTPKREASKR